MQSVLRENPYKAAFSSDAVKPHKYKTAHLTWERAVVQLTVQIDYTTYRGYLLKDKKEKQTE